jgi:hypothetical protein
LERGVTIINFTTLLEKLRNLFPSSEDIAKKTLLPIIIVTSSIALYVCGYLFLWGFYLGGNTDLSLLTVLLSYIPINKTIVTTIGSIYLLLILFFVFLFLSVKEKLKEMILSLLIASVFINLAITTLIFGEIKVKFFFQSLYFWIFPLIIALLISYYSYYLKYTKLAIVYSVGYFILLLNIVVSLTYYKSNVVDTIESLIGAVYFISTQLVLYGNSKIACVKLRKVFLLVFCVICLTPTSFLIFREKIDNMLLTILLYVLSIVVLYVIFTFLLKPKKKDEKVLVKNTNTKATPLIRTNPISSTAFFIALIVAIFIYVIPYSIIHSGESIHTFSGKRHYDTIKYVMNKEVKKINGVVLTKENNTYYISTPERKLIIVNSSDVVVIKK